MLDDVDAAQEHELTVRFTLPPGATLSVTENAATIDVVGRSFEAHWSGWHGSVGAGWVSPSYGVKEPAPTLELRARAAGGRLGVVFAPAGDDEGLETWLREAVPS